MAVGEIGREQGFEGPLSRCCQDHPVRLEVMVVSITVPDFSRIEDDVGSIGVVMSLV